jgi:NAD(P)-dependent dehydrogenase (short-subunit alcohol dehydrogenase family)
MTEKKTVVLTGASTGIGEASALYLEKKGFRVLAGVRKKADGDRLLQSASGDVEPLLIDVTETDTIAAAAEKTADVVGEGGLAGLVNNAGINVSGALEFIPLNDLREQLEVNLIGQVAMTQAFLPLLRRAPGRIVNMGSIAGRSASPMLGPYAMSKFALRAFNDSLRRELSSWNMHVSLIEPGAIATPIWEKGKQRATARFKGFDEKKRELYAPIISAVREAATKMSDTAIPAVEVAKVVHHALTAPKPRTHYLVGQDAKWTARFVGLLPPRAFDWLIRKHLGL